MRAGWNATRGVFHSCYVCGIYIVDLVALDAHEEGHSTSEKASALNHRPANSPEPTRSVFESGRAKARDT